MPTFNFENGEILNINKPSGISSFYVVKVIRAITGVRKVGHAGTLDPFASGVLLICTGKATKQVSPLMSLSKEYIGKIKLGEQTDTDDVTGSVINAKPIPPISFDEIDKVCQQFVGEIAQIPPMFSAKKIHGTKLYKIARKGVVIARPASRITIYSLTITEFQLPYITLNVTCSKGTYIRALARDIGLAIGCYAYLQSLIRTRIGNYHLSGALELNEFKKLCSTGD